VFPVFRNLLLLGLKYFQKFRGRQIQETAAGTLLKLVCIGAWLELSFYIKLVHKGPRALKMIDRTPVARSFANLVANLKKFNLNV